MQYIGIIPARYASTRFPGKPLADIGGKPMIQRVYEQSVKAMQTVVVATDDTRIEQAVKSFGGQVVMTSEQHRSGTDRCAEALDKYEQMTGNRFDVAINIQGDEPFVAPEQLRQLMSCFAAPDTDIATLYKRIEHADELHDANKPKLVFNTRSQAIYFSRWAIPYFRNAQPDQWFSLHTYYRHIGLYAYRTSVLRAITQLTPSLLETAESLEQNRWLENGYRIAVAQTDIETTAIDTPQDLEKVLKTLK